MLDDIQQMESHPPIVGIAIPAYRASETLDTTLRSCIAQTMRDWVAFVTVDGEDATQEAKIVETLGDPRIRLECNHRRVGQFANFNRAVLKCYGAGVRWVKTLCADDVLHPDALERMLEVGERESNCGLVFGYFNGIDGDGQITSELDLSEISSRIIPGRDYAMRAIPLFNPTGGPSSVMFRADVIERCGLFDGRLNYAGDCAYWFRIVSRFDVGVVGEKPILNYRFHVNSVTGREHATLVRFEEPPDVAREIAARHAPFSLEWRVAQRLLGRVVAVNLLACMAFARRGEWHTALMGANVSLRRLSMFAAPIAIAHFSGRVVRRLLGMPPTPASELEPSAYENAGFNARK